jgi:lipoate-protein ligase A
MQIRLLDVEYPEDPHLSLATEEAVFAEVMRGNSPPTFRFYRHANAVILGCFQIAEQEVDMDVIKAKNIKIVKRPTGGGAVYHDMGNLNYSIITKDEFDINMNVIKLYSTMITGALSAFKRLGINAESGKLNDVVVGNRKILGAAASIRSNTLLFHAAVLVDTNLNTMASVLKVPGEKLKDKGIKTILERVTNIKEISGKNVEDVKKALLDGYAETLGLQYNEGRLTKAEAELAQHLLKNKYTKKEWLLGRDMIDLI